MDYIIDVMCYTDKQHSFEEHYVDVDIWQTLWHMRWNNHWYMI